MEETFNEGCKGQDEYDDTPEGKAVIQDIRAWIQRMTEIPATSLVGIAAKAGRLCWSDQPGDGLMNSKVPLFNSLAADLARLAPQSVGTAA